MENPRIISPQFNSPKMPYYNVLVNNDGIVRDILQRLELETEE